MKVRVQEPIVLRGSLRDIARVKRVTHCGLYYLMLNLPYRCNYRCLKCCNILSSTVDPVDLVPFNEGMLRRLAHAAADLGIGVLVVAGEGEPLIDPDFRRVVAIAAAEGLLSYVFTNGSLLDAETVTFLHNHRASLIIGLDSISPERYRKLTGADCELSTVLTNVAHCRRVYADMLERCEGVTIGSLAINMVVNSINCDEVEKVRELCGDDIVFVCNEPTCVGRAEKNWSALYGDTPSNPDVEVMIHRMSQIQPPLGTTSDGEWCAYMRNGVSVSPHCQVLTCAYSLETAGLYRALEPNDLTGANREVMATVEEFYAEHGHSRCILRHPKYKNFITFLRIRNKR